MGSAAQQDLFALARTENNLVVWGEKGDGLSALLCLGVPCLVRGTGRYWREVLIGVFPSKSIVLVPGEVAASGEGTLDPTALAAAGHPLA